MRLQVTMFNRTIFHKGSDPSTSQQWNSFSPVTKAAQGDISQSHLSCLVCQVLMSRQAKGSVFRNTCVNFEVRN